MKSSTLQKASAMSSHAWCHRDSKSDPWRKSEVRAFVQDMDRAGYQFNECDYVIGESPSITNSWEQLFQWAESIAQNERDTARGI